METAHAVPTLASFLDELPDVASPDVSGPLAVYPLIGPMPVLEYQSFAQGVELGVSIKELDSGASVRDLVVHNPTDVPVLLFEGEEVLGAQQNRTFDVSVLVPAGSTLRVPVSCVEAHRWDGSRHGEAFRPAPQAAHPSLRRAKNIQVMHAVAAGAEPRADQGAVWDHVDQRSALHGVHSPTAAMHDVYEGRRRDLDEMCRAIEMKCSQTGMLVAVNGRFSVLDRISQPEVLDSLFRPLVQGYALDALEADTAAPVEPPSREDARAFVERILAAPVTQRDAIGLGRDARVARRHFAGAGVVVGHELVQLSVFTREPGSNPGRVRRPSRRRA